MLSDWQKEAIDAFGVRDDDFGASLGCIAKRSMFLIKDRKIAYKWVGEHPGVYPPFDELKDYL